MYDFPIYAIIPIRHESQRLPGKNYLNLGDKPLYHYVINTLLSVNEITAVIIDTNSPIIKEGCTRWNSRVIVVDRDSSLTGPTISTNTLIDNLFKKQLPYFDDPRALFLQTHVTNPFLTAETVKSAIDKLSQNTGECDSLFSVNVLHTRLYDHMKKPINHNLNNLIQTQDLPPVYEDNSCIYLFSKQSFYANNCNRLGLKPLFLEMNSEEETVDIDYKKDFELAEAYLKLKKARKTMRKIALVTGVSGGIGWEISKKFKLKGWIVIGTDIKQREKISEKYPYDYFIEWDFVTQGVIDQFKKKVESLVEKVDVLVNVAAMQNCHSVEEVKIEEWNSIIKCNLETPYFLSKELIPMLSMNPDDPGSIVNISSIHALQTSDKISIYAISKAGLSGLTRNLAIELAKLGIRVNSVCPGAIDTAMLRAGLTRGHVKGDNSDELVAALGSSHLLGFVGQPTDIAESVYFLADSRKSRFITGINLVVDGGATIRLSTE